MSSRRKISAARRVQYGALPYRLSAGSRPQFMLVTSRETRRWIIPKGWPKKGKSPHHSAAREAFEEAGVVGALPGARLVHSRMKSDSGTVALSSVKCASFPLK